MKVSDCPTTQVEVRIEASPAEVWHWLLDVDLPARFSTEFQGGGWLEGSAPGLGAQFRGRNSHPVAGEWETVSTITGFEPGRLFAWAVMDVADPAASWKFQLVPDGEGTILRQWAQIGPGPSNLTTIIGSMPEHEEEIVAMRLGELHDNMQRTVEGIKSLAESGVRAV
ncbi:MULTISPECIES: SRPBCC family protein [unclassified Amycolatopsis]|uniref:SRPBCC family protein n=1 Tax=unclassified Amycolatopsis TaxID=2618356 RepID=UPI001FF28E1E|nr:MULTISPECIES: SRPBCC family protein [unclassified Amycolatopsis]UOZ05987.1 SRPBCC family protein [Amycolatopsis sp. WQ 127309]WSJ81579.1 SRPBCC family protein [Amycolatopsis sp. NBC_01307]WSK75039.1 SRPBCC family protein [Amycolatopsis sp. NBC_01286]